MQETLFIVKPDATQKNLIGAVIKMLEEGGLEIVGLRMLKLSREQAERFYDIHKDKPFYSSLVDFMTSGRVVAGVAAGEGAVERCRAIMGATDPPKAGKGTIRALYGENIQNNAIHGSDSSDNAEHEIRFFFPDLAGSHKEEAT